MLVNLHHIDHRILYSNVRLEGGVSVVELWQLEGSDNSFLVQALECHQVVDIVLFCERTHHFLIIAKLEIIVYERELSSSLQWREMLRISLLRDMHCDKGCFVFPFLYVVTSEEATVMNILTAASYLFTANVLSVQAYRDAVLSYTGNYLAVVLPFDNLSSASLTSSASSTNPTSQHLTVYDLSPLLGANPSSHQDLEIFHSSTQLLADDPIIRTSFRRTYAHTSSDLLVTLHQSGKVVIYEVAQVQELEDDSIVAIALNAAIRVGKLGVGEKIGGEKGGDQDSSENTSLVRIVEKVVVKKILEVAHTHLLQYVSNHSDGTDILKSVGVGWIYGIGCTSTNAPSSATPSSPAIPPLIPSSKGAIRKDKVVSVWGGNGVWLVIHMQATDGSVCVVCVFVQYDYYTKEYVVAYDKMLKFALQVDAGVDVPVRIHENINAYFCTHTTLPTALDVVYGLDIPAHTHARSSSFMVSRALLSIHSQPPHTHNHIHTHVQRMSCYLVCKDKSIQWQHAMVGQNHMLELQPLYADKHAGSSGIYGVRACCALPSNPSNLLLYSPLFTPPNIPSFASLSLPNDLHHTLHIHALHHSDENTVYVALYKVASMCMHAKFGKELDTFVDTSDTHTHNDSPNLTPVDDTYTVAIHPDPVYGLGLRLDEVKTQTHTNIVVTAFKPHPVTNQPMACEVTGCIQLGDHLIGVNDVSFSESTSAGEVGGNNSTTTGLPLATVVKHIKAACSAGQGRSEVVLKLRRAQQTQVHKLALQAPAAPTQTPRYVSTLTYSHTHTAAGVCMVCALPAVQPYTTLCMPLLVPSEDSHTHKETKSRLIHTHLVLVRDIQVDSPGLVCVCMLACDGESGECKLQCVCVEVRCVYQYGKKEDIDATSYLRLKYDIHTQVKNSCVYDINVNTQTQTAPMKGIYITSDEIAQGEHDMCIPIHVHASTHTTLKTVFLHVSTDSTSMSIQKHGQSKPEINPSTPIYVSMESKELDVYAYLHSVYGQGNTAVEDDNDEELALQVQARSYIPREDIHTLEVYAKFWCKHVYEVTAYGEEDEYDYGLDLLLTLLPTYSRTHTIHSNSLASIHEHMQNDGVVAKFLHILTDKLVKYMSSSVDKYESNMLTNIPLEQGNKSIVCGELICALTPYTYVLTHIHSLHCLLSPIYTLCAEEVKSVIAKVYGVENGAWDENFGDGVKESTLLSGFMHDLPRMLHLDVYAYTALYGMAHIMSHHHLVFVCHTLLNQQYPKMFSKKLIVRVDEEEGGQEFSLDKGRAQTLTSTASSPSPIQHLSLSGIQIANLLFSTNQMEYLCMLFGELMPSHGHAHSGSDESLSSHFLRDMLKAWSTFTYTSPIQPQSSSAYTFPYTSPPTVPNLFPYLLHTDILTYMVDVKLSLWLHDILQVIPIIATYSLNTYRQTKRCMGIFLEMVLVGKVDTLINLCKTDSSPSGKQLLQLLYAVNDVYVSLQSADADRTQLPNIDTSHPKFVQLQSKLHKNAFALIRRQMYRQAAAVFLLAPTHGNIKAALNCLAGQNNDPCLAHLVARVLETRIGTRNMNGNSMSSNIGGSSYDIPDVVQKLQKDAQKVSNIYSHQVLTHDLIPALQKASQSHSSLEEANFCGFVGVDATVVGVVGALWLQDDGMLRTKFDSLLHHLKRDIHTHTGSLSERTSLIVSSEWCAAMTGMYRDKLAASDIRIIHDFLQYVGIHIPTIHHHHSMHLLCIWLISLAEMLDKKSDGTNGLCVDKVRDVYETYYSLHDLHEEVLLVGEIIDKPIANAFASFTQRMMEEGKQKRLQAHTQLMASTSTPTSQNNQSSPTPAAPKMTFNFASMSKPTPPSSISVQPAARSVLDMYDVPPKAPVQAATVPSSALDTYDAPARPQRSATAGSSDRTAAPSALDMFDVPTRPQRSTTSKVNSSASHAPSALDMFDAPSRPLRSSAGPSAGTNSGPANAEASNINVNANVSASVGGVHSALDVFDAPSRPLRSNAATGSGAYNNASASAVGVPNALDTFEAPSRPLRSTGGSGVNSNAVSANSGVGSGKGSANVAPNALDMFDVPSRPLRSGAESGGSTNASSGTSSANIILHASGSGSAGAVSNALDMFDAPSRPLRNTAGLDAVANSSEVISAASNAHASTNANDNDANVHASSNSSSVGAPNALDVFDVPSRPLRSSVGSSVSATSSTASSRVNDINVIAGAATSVGAPNALDMFDVPSRPLRSSAGSSVNSNAGSVIQGAITGNVHASAVGVPNALDVFDAPSRPLRSSSGTGATGGAAGSNVDAKASAHVSSSSSSVGVPHAVDVFDVPSRPVRSSTGSGASTNASTASTGGKSGNSSVITHTVDDFKAVSTPGAQMQSVESSVSASSAPSFGSSPPPQPTPSVVSAALPHAPKPPSLSVASTPAMSSLLDLDIPTIPEEKDGYNEDAGDGDILTSPKLLSASSDERERVLSALRKETSMSSMPSMGNIDIMEEIRKIEDASSGTKVKPQTPTPSSIPAPAPSTPTSNEGGKKEGKLLVPFKHQEAGSASASKVVDSAKKGTHHVEGGGGLQHKSSFLGGLFHPHGHPPSSASKRSTPNSSAHGGSTHGVTREPHPHSSPSSSVLTEFEQRIFRFYSIHNPDKLDTVRDIVKKFEGRENELIAKLERQYKANVV